MPKVLVDILSAVESTTLPSGYLLPEGTTMADVRRLELELLASEGLKIEDLEEHRHILREALRSKGSAQSLKEILLAMPDVGEDRDFARPKGRGRTAEL